MDASLSHGLEKLAEKLSTIVNQIQFLSVLNESEKTLVGKLVARVQKLFSACRANRVRLEDMVLTAKSLGTHTQLGDEAMMCSLLAGQGEEVLEVVDLIIRAISSMFPERRRGSVSENVSVLSQRSDFTRCEKLMADALQAQSEANDLARTARHNATVAEFKTRLNNKKSPPPLPNQKPMGPQQSIDEETAAVPNSVEVTPEANSEYIYPINNEYILNDPSYQTPPAPREIQSTQEALKTPAPTQTQQPISEISIPTERQKKEKSCCSGTVIFICLLVLLLAAGGGAALYFFVLK